MVDVVADAERQVDLLRLQPGDLTAQDLVRRFVTVTRPAQQLVVALVAAEDRVREIEEDDRGLGEVREPLVLDPAAGGHVPRGCGLHDLIGVDGALRRQRINHRLTGQRLGPDAGSPIPRRTLPEALRGGVGVFLRGVQSVRAGSPRRRRRRIDVDGPVVGHVRPVECLGHRPHRLRPEAQRLALVGGQLIGLAGPGEDGDDGDVLAQLAQAGDQPAARERNVVGMRGDEDVGHGDRVYGRTLAGGPTSGRVGVSPGSLPRRATGRRPPVRRSARATRCRGAECRAAPGGRAARPGSRACRRRPAG